MLLPHSRKAARGVTTRGVVAVVRVVLAACTSAVGASAADVVPGFVYGLCWGSLGGRRLRRLVESCAVVAFTAAGGTGVGFNKKKRYRALSTGSSSRYTWRRGRVCPLRWAMRS